jgi:hypothetical protein
MYHYVNNQKKDTTRPLTKEFLYILYIACHIPRKKSVIQK